MYPAYTADRPRTRVWMALAEQFLDTETRTWIPNAALACLEAGCDLREARHIWRYEVTPAVWSWDLVGEWAGWDDNWLIGEIERLRGRWPNRPGMLPYLVYRLRVHVLHGSWLAIERCLRALLAVPAPERAGRARDLTALAEHYFGLLHRRHGGAVIGAAAGVGRAVPNRVSAGIPAARRDLGWRDPRGLSRPRHRATRLIFQQSADLFLRCTCGGRAGIGHMTSRSYD